jgi:hypothetical protein
MKRLLLFLLLLSVASWAAEPWRAPSTQIAPDREPSLKTGIEVEMAAILELMPKN